MALGFASQDVQNWGAPVVSASSSTSKRLAAAPPLQPEARTWRYAEADVANNNNGQRRAIVADLVVYYRDKLLSVGGSIALIFCGILEGKLSRLLVHGRQAP